MSCTGREPLGTVGVTVAHSVLDDGERRHDRGTMQRDSRQPTGSGGTGSWAGGCTGCGWPGDGTSVGGAAGTGSAGPVGATTTQVLR